MIVAVTEMFYDYEPKQYFLDTNKLNPKNYLENLILKECNLPENKLHLCVDAADWEERFPDRNPVLTHDVRVENGPAEKILLLTIFFE